MDKKWIFGIISGIIIVPALTFGWKNIQAVWAAPKSIKTVDSKVDKTKSEVDKVTKIEQELTGLILEQKARIEKNEALDDLRAKNAEQQLNLIAELKKKK